MKIVMAAAFSIMSLSAALPLAANAYADDAYQQFASPSGNIRCILNGQDGPAPIAMCQISDHTYVVPAGLLKDETTGRPCPSGSGGGGDFRLDPGKPGFLRCSYSALGSGFGPWPALAYGQTRSLGPLVCDSEPKGMTCTDTASGHFFRVSRQGYELG
jgi:hypothetical protein